MHFKVHIIHVGNMANKGTQALLKSDVSVLRSVIGPEVKISVSTTDVNGVRSMNLPLVKVLPPVVDIPYERSDFFAKKFGIQRRHNFKYKFLAIGSLLLMLFQAGLSVFSVTLTRISLRGFYRGEVLRTLKEADVVVSCSDENFKEAASFLSLNVYWIAAWWSMLFSRAWDVLCTRFLGKHIVMFPNSVGPFRTRFGRFLAKFILNRMDYILIREPISYDVVKTLCVKSPKILTSDTSVLLNGDYNACFEGLPYPLLGVSPGFYAQSLSRRDVERYILGHARALDIAVEKFGFYVVFLPHYVSGFSNDDLDISRSIMEIMRNKSRAVVYEAKSVEDFKSALDRMNLVISSKMHPAVLAVSSGVPTICIAYDQKQTGFFNHLGLDECVILIRDFSDDVLLHKINSVWSRREEIKGILNEKVPLLQKSVIEAVTVALRPFIKSGKAEL